MLRVGLTGGIACGKSTVGGMLARRGAHYLQADNLAHDLYAPGAVTYAEVVRVFGRKILNDDGMVNRGRLASLAFPDRIAELNAIVHPAVIQAQKKWMAQAQRDDPNGIAVVEAALVLEAGAEADFDRIVVVTCDPEHKAERYAGRMGISLEAARAEVLRRSAAQLPDAEKARRADFLIDNSGSVEDTERQVENLWQELQALQGQVG
jgi:dephospho-CoA kinase